MAVPSTSARREPALSSTRPIWSVVYCHPMKNWHLCWMAPPIVIWNSEWPGALRYGRSEEHTSELQSLMRISYAVFCLKKKNTYKHNNPQTQVHLPHASQCSKITNRNSRDQHQ